MEDQINVAQKEEDSVMHLVKPPQQDDPLDAASGVVYSVPLMVALWIGLMLTYIAVAKWVPPLPAWTPGYPAGAVLALPEPESTP